MSDPFAKLPTSLPRAKRHKRNYWSIIGGVSACCVLLLLVIGRIIFSDPTEPELPDSGAPIVAKVEPPLPTDSTNPATVDPNAPPTIEASPTIDDDGKTLWMSPTEGKPLDLAFMSPGAQIIIALRPAALLKHAEGEKIRAALGPTGQQAIALVESATTIPLAEIDRLVVGCQATADAAWLANYVVHSVQPVSIEWLLAKLQGAVEKEHSGKKYWLANDRAYYIPGGTATNVLVVATEESIHDVIDLAGQMPPLRRDIERLITNTDNDRQLTIVLAPNSLFNEGQSMFSGEMQRLRAPLFWFLGDELSGAALSINWDADFFLELIATPTLETSPEKAAQIFATRVSEIPANLEEYVVNLNAQPYSRLVVARFPEMVRKLATYTRQGFDRDHATLRCYLPVVAGHNLLLAAELTLAEAPTTVPNPPSPDGAVASATAPLTVATPATLQDRLAKVTTLKFTKDTLESALDQLAQDIGIPIIIRGPDLQADGITKNQSFGIDISNQPAEQILVEILRLANPDKTATAANDPRQKLVYIIEQTPDKTEQIVVTTRARAAERKNELPTAFRPEQP